MKQKKIKIVFLAPATSIHTERWVNSLAEKNEIEIHLISAHKKTIELNPKIHFHELNIKAPLGYYLAKNELKYLLKEIRPDLLNAHYATGYGLLARFSQFHPVLLSIWGSDVYDFPIKSSLHRYILRKNLSHADAIASTSHCMANKMMQTYKHKSVSITPFGIDVDLFKYYPKPSELKNKIIVGTVKTLEYKYGIDTLIKSFAEAWLRLGKPNNLFLEISGDGNDLNGLKKLCDCLNISNLVKFHGRIEHKKVPEILNRLDIYVSLSRLDSESFGVAILEAASCEKPVIVSNVDGLKEVTLDGINGIVVPKENINEISSSLIELIKSKELRTKMGKAGREHVLKNYTWEKSLLLMETTYRKTIEN